MKQGENLWHREGNYETKRGFMTQEGYFITRGGDLWHWERIYDTGREKNNDNLFYFLIFEILFENRYVYIYSI